MKEGMKNEEELCCFEMAHGASQVKGNS